MTFLLILLQQVYIHIYYLMTNRFTFSVKCLKSSLFVFLLVAVAGILPVSAQTDNNATITSGLKSGSNEEKLKAYEALYKHFQYTNTDSASYYLTLGLSQFTADKYKLGIASMLFHLGNIYASQGSTDLGRSTEEDALTIFTEINEQKGIANAHNALGVMVGKRSNYAEAVKHFLVALKIFQDIHDTDGIANTYIKLGTANERSGNLNEALAFYNRGLAILKGRKINVNTIELNNNIGSVYAQMNMLDTAELYFKSALQLSSDTDMKRSRIISLTNMGNLADIKYNDTAAALGYFREVLRIATTGNMAEEYVRAMIGIAAIVARTDVDGSMVIMFQLLQKTRAMGERKLQREVLTSIIDYYKTRKNYEQALFYMEQYLGVEDSISKVDRARAVASLQSIYEDEKLNSKIEELKLSEQKQKQKKNYIIVISLLLAVTLAVVVFFLRQTRRLYASLSRRKAQLIKNNEVKDKMFSIIGHDLIGAIGAIPAAIQIATDKDTTQEERDSFLELVEQNATASYETLQNLLSWGKAQIQGIVLNQVNINVNEVAAEALRYIKIAANTKEVTISNNLPPGTKVYADPDHFSFIIRNLLSNAVKYSRCKGDVVLNASPSPDNVKVIFSIKDSGIGIASDKKPEIFHSFGITTEGTANEKGNGIGLKLCKEFVVENGGEIWVESEPGKGATFFFSLKAAR
ncbi:MAG: hypothetical protein JWQ38_946 [Flavipsychrobacter sp.]|nr:hypothetical protein [Flavipsychrobacter sp.]